VEEDICQERHKQQKMAENRTFAESYTQCTDVSPLCPVEATVLSYTPNLAANIFFTAAFGVMMVGTFVIGFWKKTWTFAAAVGCGAILETVGEFFFFLRFPSSMQLQEPN
jgi:hypothetical protein